MFIVWGKGFYGSVDRIRGLGPVKTRFFHLFFFPLIPLESVISTQSGAYPLSELHGRSILMAYIRAVLWPLALVLTIAVPRTLSRGDFLGFLMFLISAGLLVGSYIWMRHATYERAADIFRYARVSTEDALLMRESYGKLDKAELARGDRDPAGNVLNRMHVD
jgi:hypothetical protein